VLQEQVVEVGPLDLVGHRVVRVARLGEDHGARGAVRFVPEERAVLRLVAGGADLLVHSEAVEDRKREGKERFAHVEAGKLLALDEHDASACAREGRRDGRASRAATDDDRVVD
jgi:hypothetical protein